MKTNIKKVETRVCRLCDEEKTLDLFEVDNRVKGGRTSRCRECKHGLDDRASVLYRGLRRRARLAGQKVDVTREELQALFAAFDGECVYCGITEDEAGRSHHVDHLIPVSKGGRHHRSNLVLACASCNSSKSKDTLIEFYERRKDKVSAANFNTVVHYVALMSGQPVDEVLTSFMVDFQKSAYRNLTELITDEELHEAVRESVKKKYKTEAG